MELSDEQVETLIEALEFYADPETYFAIGFFPDHPCGEFCNDFSDTGSEWGVRPGAKARAVLTELISQLEEDVANVREELEDPKRQLEEEREEDRKE